MPQSRTAHHRDRRRTLGLAACAALAMQGPALAEERVVQGLFCNTEDQIDGALALVASGLSARTAVDLANGAGVVCTCVDRLHYVVERPVSIGGSGFVPFAKYRAMLTGVVAGGRLRAVSPPVEVFFVTPDRLAGAAVERRT
jgi:hypothetical protein